MKKKILPIIILSFLFGGVVFAQEFELPSPGLTPDSPFYFLDRIAEVVQEFITFDPESKARLQVTFAAERIAEMKAMLEIKGVETKGLEVAQAHLEKHAEKAVNVVEKEKEKGNDVSRLAGEIVDAFHEKRTEAKAIFEETKKDFQTQKSQLHQELLTAIKAGDAQEQERIREEIAEIEAKKNEAEAKKKKAVEALEREKDRLRTELEETKRQEDMTRDEIEEAKDKKKEIWEKQQKQREKIDETQAMMEKCIELVYGEGKIISSPEKDIEVKKCVVAYTTEPPIEEPPQLPEEPERQEYYGPRIDIEGVKELMSQEGFVGPGGCHSFEECDVYCKTSGHMGECMAFVIERGLIKIDLIKMNDEKINELMGQEGFIGPGGCRSLQECGEYCKISENVKECIVFLDEYGLIPSTGPSPEAPEETPPPPPLSDPIVDKCIQLVYGTGEIISSPEKDIEVKKCVMSYEEPPPEETPPEPPATDPIMDKCTKQVYGEGEIISTPEKDIEVKKCVVEQTEGLPPEETPPLPPPADPILEKCRELVYGENIPFSLEKEIEVKKCVVAYEEETPPEEVPPEPPAVDPIMEKCIKQVYGEGEYVSTPEKDIEVKKCVMEHEVETECLSLGEGINPSLGPEYSNLGKECCEELKLIQTENQFDENCNPILLEGAGSICASCGNGVCEDLESRCNCPEDCKINIPPKFTSLPIFPELINIGQSIPFTWNAIDRDNDDLAWSINWGDGHNTESLCPDPNSFSQKDWNFSASHAWEKAGTYMLTATVSDCKGGTNSASINVKVGEVEEIEPTIITVISPNGGEILQAGKTYDITWESTLPAAGNSDGNEKANIYLQFGSMSGTQCTLSGICCSICGNWRKIASAVPTSDGKYSWTISADKVINGEYKIHIRTINDSCFNNTCLSDTSDDFFSIEVTSTDETSQGIRVNQMANVLESAKRILDRMSDFLKIF